MNFLTDRKSAKPHVFITSKIIFGDLMVSIVIYVVGFHTFEPVIFDSLDLFILGIQSGCTFLVCSLILFLILFLDITACFPKHFKSPLVFFLLELIEVIFDALIYFFEF